MTDDEWIKTIPSLTNEELLDKLDYCGYDTYYRQIREPVVAEIARRLKENARLKKESEENQDLATIAYMQGMNKNKAKLDEAKEIIRRFYRLIFLREGFMELNDFNVWKSKAEAFLKE